MINTRLRATSSKVINRSLIAETGIIPAGYRLIQDTWPLVIKDTKKVVVEGINGKETPALRLMGLFQRAEDVNANNRIYTKDVLGEAVDAIQEDINQRTILGEFDHPCVCTSDFRVLTVDGFKEFKDIQVGDYVWSRVDGQMVKSRVNAITDEPYDGPAYRIRGKNINVEFTPGHKFILVNKSGQKYVTADEVYHNRSKYGHDGVPRTAKWAGNNAPVFTIPGIRPEDLAFGESRYNNTIGFDASSDLVFETKKFAAFLGLYLAEGYTRFNRIYISQIGGSKEIIRELLNTLHDNLQWKETKNGFHVWEPRLARYLKRLGNKYEKFIPAEVKNLNSECLEELIYWFAVGDGRVMSGSRSTGSTTQKTLIATANRLEVGKYSIVSIFTTSKRLIDDLHECVIKTGRCAKPSEIVQADDYVFADHVIKAENKKTLYQLHISRQKSLQLDKRFTSIEPIHHVGRIYCLSVDHGNFYMERDNCTYWTGNSDAKVHLDRVSHLITKVWMEGKDVWGEAEVLDKLHYGSELRGLIESGVRPGISSRGVGDMEVRESNGQELYYVMPGYSLVTWDVVAEPSVKKAYLNIAESTIKRRNMQVVVPNHPLFSKTVYESRLVKAVKELMDDRLGVKRNK